MVVPDRSNLKISMYNPEHFIEHGIFSEPFPAREIPPPPPAELYNIAKDPEERRNLAESEPQRAKKLLIDLENGWPVSFQTYPMFHEVCMEEIRSIDSFLQKIIELGWVPKLTLLQR